MVAFRSAMRRSFVSFEPPGHPGGYFSREGHRPVAPKVHVMLPPFLEDTHA